MSQLKDFPLVSIVIRNKNEANHLQYVFEAIGQQEYKNHEIILVDNNSTDESLELAQKANAKIVSISNFTYGSALNLGIEAASGEIIVILSAHSIPLGRYFLDECVRAFEDETVGAARLVYAGKGSDSTKWLKSEYLTSPDQDFISKGPLASGCAIRKKAWEKVKFDETIVAAEEKIWTFEILKLGYKVITPIPAFYFYNKRLSPEAELVKNYRELVAIDQSFGRRVGFVNVGRSKSIVNFFKSVLNSFSISFKQFYIVVLRLYLRLKFPKL